MKIHSILLGNVLALALCAGLCACGDDNSSSAPEESSSSAAESSSSRDVYETPCSVSPTWSLVWPKDGADLTSLENDFRASSNTISCDRKIEVESATLYYKDSSENYKEIGTVDVTTKQDSANPRVWKISYNLNELASKHDMVDGSYKVVLEFYGEKYEVNFNLVRSFEEVFWTLDFSEEKKDASVICDGCRYGRYIFKTFLLDSEKELITEISNGKLMGLVVGLDGTQIGPGVFYSLDSLWSTLQPGMYTLRFVAISPSAAPDEETYLKLRAYGEPKDSVENAKFAWAVDKDYNIRSGLLGTVKDTVFVVEEPLDNKE